MAFSWSDEMFDDFFSDPFFRGFPDKETMGFGRRALPRTREQRFDDRKQRGKREKDIEKRGERDWMTMMDPFKRMNDLMKSHVSSDDPNAYSFTSSSFQSYSKTDKGEPKIYEATSSTRKAPGGIKETRKSVRDSERGVEKVHIGHHINDRAHIMERSVNKKTGNRKEKQNFLNMQESDGPKFDEEWQKRTREHNKLMMTSERARGSLPRGEPRRREIGLGRKAKY
ncbi:myeloid leukemia factor 1-like [Oscarella lobularis]|uniref:myeloid leukemia factor 1-like n=1 Tax=Oscarella lobularis TaxID=121494 RepID=UPI003313DCFB